MSTIGETTTATVTVDATTTTPTTAAETSTDTSGTSPTTTMGTTGSTGTCANPCENPKVLEGSFNVDPQSTQDFGCVTEINGDLAFFSSGWIREQFSTLKRVNGVLSFNLVACDLSFLSCLEFVDSLVITYPDDCFVDLSGLESLTTIASVLRITDADGMTSLSGLDSVLNGPTSLELVRNAKLASFGNFVLPSAMDSVILTALPEIADLSLLQGIETVQSLVVSDLPKITTFNDLGKLVEAGRFELGPCSEDSPALGLISLVDLTGLSALTHVGTLSIAGNPSLMALSGAPLLTQMDTVVIVGNAALSDESIAEFLAQNANANADVCFGDIGACKCP